MANRKVQEDKDGVYVKINNTVYRPDTLLEKDTEHTRQVREYYAQITESADITETKDQPTRAEKGQTVNVEQDGEARAVTVSIPLPEDDEGNTAYDRTETWIAADVPELSEEQKQEIRENAITAKQTAKQDGAQGKDKMDFFQSLMEQKG
jgi:D-alanine-D-alanine ligase-like ATP-grasp enzyme